MDKRYIMTYDFGTSSLKAVILDELYTIVGVHYVPYPTYSDKNGYMEQRVEDYWNSFCEATKALIAKSNADPKQIIGLAMSQTTADVILTDEDGNALGNCIIWIDSRAEAQADEINARAGYTLYQGKNVPSKVKWIKENKPQLFEKAAHLLDVSAYLYLRLTGEYAYDITGAFGSQMLDDESRTWSEQKLAWAEIPRRLLPDRIVGATEKVGSVLPAAAKETGLAAGTPVFGGCSDNANGQIGTGCIRSGDIHFYLGSSGWFEVTTDDDEVHRGSYPSAIDGMRYHYRCTDSACSSIDYVLRTFYKHEMDTIGNSAYDLMNIEIEAARQDPQEVLFLPFLFGEQDPVADMNVRGTILNITPTTTRGHIACAVMEGIAFNLRWMKEQQIELTGKWTNKPIRTYGGGSMSDTMMQITADVLNDTLVRLCDPRTVGNVGIGVCAGIGAGISEDFTVLDSIVKEEKTFVPNEKRQEAYRRKYAIYRGTYEALMNIYNALNGAQL